MMSKRFAIVALQLLFCLAITSAQLDEVVKKCKADTGVKQANIDSVNKGVFPNDRNLMCYMACLLQTLKMMNEKGEFTYTEDVLRVLPPEKFESHKRMIEACLPNARGADACKKAFSFHKCCSGVDKKNYFLY